MDSRVTPARMEPRAGVTSSSSAVTNMTFMVPHSSTHLCSAPSVHSTWLQPLA